MNQTKKNLLRIIINNNIETSQKYLDSLKSNELIRIIKYYFSSKHKKKGQFGFEFINSMDSPMLAQRQFYFNSEKLKSLLKNKDYFADEKINGERILISYCPRDGFNFFSRNQDYNFVFIDLTDKIYINNSMPSGVDWKNKFNYRFILDCEITAEKRLFDHISKRYNVLSQKDIFHHLFVQFDANNTIMHQKKYGPLLINCFTALYCNEDIREKNEFERLVITRKIINQLRNKNINIRETKKELNDKTNFLKEILLSAGEGIILKNKDTKYYSEFNRGVGRWIKIKEMIE